jgi:hypothetical protein
MNLRLLSFAIAVVAFAFSYVHSQPASQPNDSELALEISFLKDTPPAYQNVPRLRSKKSSAWYARFGRVPGWQEQQGILPVTAVRLSPYLRGDTVVISVSVLRGDFHDVEDQVAIYKARENETVTTTALQKVGIEPFVIKVVRPTLFSEFPAPLNKTQSLSVIGIEPVPATLPRYKLTLTNLSEKSVSALTLDVISNGKLETTTMPQGDYGAPLIEARATIELNKGLATRSRQTPGGFEPTNLTAPQVVIQSLVFADGSYEGEAKSAAAFLGFVAGRRTELRRILPLLANAIVAGDAVASSEALRSQLTALSYEPDPDELASLIAAFPAVPKDELNAAVNAAIHALRADLLKQLLNVEKAEANATAFSAWLVRTKGLYSSWLDRLNEIKLKTR